jgi:hypothetical protein
MMDTNIILKQLLYRFIQSSHPIKPKNNHCRVNLHEYLSS